MASLLDNILEIFNKSSFADNIFDLSTKEGHDKAISALDDMEENPLVDAFFGEGWKDSLRTLIDECYHEKKEEEKEELPEYIHTIDPKIKDNIMDLVDEYINTVVKVRMPDATPEQLESVGDVLDDFGAWMYQKK